jgi:hypothetical protein
VGAVGRRGQDERVSHEGDARLGGIVLLVGATLGQERQQRVVEGKLAGQMYLEGCESGRIGRSRKGSRPVSAIGCIVPELGC